jgi:pentatricopeptide repeat protein
VAYANLGILYSGLGESVLAIENTTKAYQLRDRASDRERFFIATFYDRQVTGNLEKELQTLQLWTQTYPRDMDAYGLTAGLAAHGTGNYELAHGMASKALSLDPDCRPCYTSLAASYVNRNRLDEADQVFQKAAGRNLKIPDLLPMRFYAAFLRRNTAGMDEAAALAKGIPGADDWLTHSRALVAAHSGRAQLARNISQEAIQLAEREGQRERAATYRTAVAVWEALFGNSSQAKRNAYSALDHSNGRDVTYAAAFALATAGDFPRAQALAKDLEKRFPEDTSVQFSYLPSLRALFALKDKDPAKAIEYLQKTETYEFAMTAINFNTFFGGLYPVHVRASAYMAAGQPKEAVTELQKIIDHPGVVLADPVGALTYLQLGRASAMAGDKTKAKAAYEHFLSLWKDADSDIPVLNQAKAEYAKL